MFYWPRTQSLPTIVKNNHTEYSTKEDINLKYINTGDSEEDETHEGDHEDALSKEKKQKEKPKVDSDNAHVLEETKQKERNYEALTEDFLIDNTADHMINKSRTSHQEN